MSATDTHSDDAHDHGLAHTASIPVLVGTGNDRSLLSLTVVHRDTSLRSASART